MSARRPVPGAGWGGRPPRPPALPHDPPVSPPDEWGDERVAALLSEADQLMAAAQHDTSAAERLEAAGVGRLTQDGDGPSLSERLILLHAAEAARDTRSSNLNLSSNLLERLNQVDPLNRVVVQLWPGDEGYSIALAARDGSQTDLGLRLSYNDNHILDCIDNEEIPVIISDLLEGVAVDLFYSGCVVAEVRDHRREGGVVPSAGPPHSKLVLLRPSTQSIICDSQALAKSAGQGKWTSDERNSVESQVVLATQGPLCLDPSPVVSLLANKTNHAKLKFNTVPLRRAAARRYSQAGINRKRKLEAAAAPPELRLHDFIQNLNNGRVTGAAGAAAAKRKTTPVESLTRHREASRAAFQQAEALIAGILPPPANASGCLNLVSPDLRLAVPAQVDVAKHVRPIGRRADTNDMTPQVVEEYVLETAERGQARVYHTRLTILQRQANDEYIGELYVERDYKEGDNKGSTCRFLLGTRPHALRYINQFTEIFTEEGRKSVKITHRVPNQAPRITFTPGMRASMTAAAAGTSGPQAAILQRKNSGAQTPTVTAAQTTSVQQVTAVLQTTTTMASGQRGVSIQLQPQQVSQAKLPASIAAATVTSVAPVQTPHPHLLPPHSAVTTTVPSSIASKLPTIPLNPANIQATSTMIPSGSVQVGSQSIQVGSQSIQLGGPNGQTIQVGGPNGQTIQVGGPNGQTIQVGGPNGQTIQVGGTNGQTIQVGNSNITVPGGIQVQMPGGPQQDTQQEAISAIVQSLMNAGAQFEHQKKMEEQRKVPPSVNVASASPVQVVSGAVLPTVPVPPASLVGQSGLVGQLQVSQSSLGQLQVSQSNLVQSGLVGQLQVSQSSLGQLQVSQSSLGQLQVTQSSLGQLQVTQSNLGQLQVTQSSLGQLQVTQSNLGQLQVSQSSLGQLQVSQPNLVTVSGQRLAPGRVTLQNLLSGSSSSSAKVTMPQLAAQLSRPYTNVTVTASLPTYSQALAASHQTSPRPAARRPSEQPSPDLPLSSPTPHSTPGLHALLADTPAADKPVTGGCGGNLMVGSNSTLLERLVSGGSHPTSLSSGSTLSQVATQLPMSNHASSDTNEITLAALLANPPKSQHPPATSPTKSVQMSPLLQQLQQPIQSVNPGRLYSTSLTSPRQTSTPSPQPNLTSPRPLQPAPSPRPLQPAQSPRASALQQQLMQPPSIRYQSPGQSILSAQLSAPITSRPTQSLLSQQLQQSSQPQLLQQGVVQVAQSNVLMSQSNQAVVTVTLQDLNTNNAATLNAITSMNAANGTVTVTGRPLSTSTIQPSFVNLSGVQQVQLVNQNSQGGVQLVNQSIPVQLSIPGHSQPITFSVNLPDNQHNATNGSMSSSPLIMSSVNNQPNKTHAVTVSSVGKFVSNGPNAGTVVLQGPGGNIIHLPQQPNQAQFSNIKPAPMSSVVRTSMGGGGVVMRQPSPLLVQMPGSVSTPQPIQIVRSVPVNQPPMNMNNALQSPQHHQLKNSLASPSPSGPPTPQTPGVPPSPPNNVGHPGPNNVLPPDSPLVAVQLGNHAQDHLQPHFLLSNQKQTQLVPQPLAGQILGNQTMNNQPHLKMRQQRKQSLK